MDHPARTAAYHTLIHQRKSILTDTLDRLCAQPMAGSVVWEVGCGHGHFLAAYAHAHPDRFCIGIDLVSERIERANRKRDRAGLTNLHFIHADARLFLDVLPAHVAISSVFVLFPDPWPKLRHHKHRIMQPEFLRQLAQRAGEGARLYFRTDYRPYYDETRQVIASHPDWTCVEEPWPFERETVFQSRAESYASLVAKRHAPIDEGRI